MPSLPAARITHFTTGRLRIKVPEKRRDPAFFNAVADRLSTWVSIERVETNPLTASILVYFSDWGRLFSEAVAKNDLFEIDFNAALTQSSEPELIIAATRSFETADHSFRRWTDNQLDIRSAVFVLLFAGGVYQLVRGRWSTPAPTLLWYAGNLLGLWSDRPTNARSGASAASGQAG